VPCVATPSAAPKHRRVDSVIRQTGRGGLEASWRVTNMAPSASSTMWNIGPANCVFVRRPSAVRCANPDVALIHKLPSRAASSAKIVANRRSSPLGGPHRSKRAPSNRTKPDPVPIQRYPSVVWASESGSPGRYPSRSVQAVCAYWVRRRLGSSARAELAVKISVRKRNRLSRDLITRWMVR